MEKTELDTEIVRQVSDCWKNQGRVILLSELGALSGGDIARTARKFAPSLSAYLEFELAEDITILKHSTRPTVVGAVPKSVQPMEQAKIDQTLQGSTNRNSGKIQFVRFDSDFWQAFRNPLDAQARRFVIIHPNRVEWVDLRQEEPNPAGGIDIAREFIAENFETPGQMIHENILNWARIKNMSIDQFSRKSLSATKVGSSFLSTDSLLSALLSALSHDDLKRISLPLDIANKLARTRR